jgi:hypothetical protein
LLPAQAGGLLERDAEALPVARKPSGELGQEVEALGMATRLTPFADSLVQKGG